MFHYLLKRAIYLFVKSLMITYRYKWTGMDHRQMAIAAHPKGSFIVPVWHGQVFGILTAHAGTAPFLVMASRSKDGDFAAYVSEKFGFIPVRGSSRKGTVDKGGKEAMELYVEKLKVGNLGGITVDGPKGPAFVCKPGIVIIASKAQCMILPISASCSQSFRFQKSWDKFQIPLPFSRILLSHAAPIPVPANANPEEIEHVCRVVEKRLSEAQKDADQKLQKWIKGEDLSRS
ncbi:MAG: lysophospholipid acyltransferase family protein [Bacteriovoracaceae bacterium]